MQKVAKIEVFPIINIFDKLEASLIVRKIKNTITVMGNLCAAGYLLCIKCQQSAIFSVPRQITVPISLGK